MCHEHLKVEFGSHINFIVGQNGSGKSAILAALMVCLGSSANRTQRGHKVSSLIKEGANFLSVTVTFNNSGIDQYKWEKLGDSFSIERRVSDDGSSIYKIKTSTGVSFGGEKPREIVREIVRFFRIQVENPLVILTQDVAKRYLASSSPSERYTLIMQGSQLQRLAEDYERTGTLVSQMRDHLAIASGKINEQSAKVRQIQVQIDAIKEARELLSRLADARRRLVWAQVFEVKSASEQAEAQKEELINELSLVGKKLEEVNQSLSLLVSSEETSQATTEEIRSSKLPPVHLQISQIESQISLLNSQLANIASDEKVLQQGRSQLVVSSENLASSTSELLSPQVNASMDLNIEKTRALKFKLQEKEGQLKDIDSKKNEMEGRISKKESQLAEINLHESRLASSLRITREQLEYLESQIPAARSAISMAEVALLSNSSSVESTRLASYAELSLLYGSQMTKLVQYLDSLNGPKPLGPVGRFLHLKDPATWSMAMDALIGRHMTSFIVTSYQERAFLEGLFKQFDIRNSQIVLLPADVYAHPPTDINISDSLFTARMALEIMSPIVDTALCLLTGIHRVLLSTDRTEASKLLASKKGQLDSAFLSTGQKINLSTSAQTFFSYGSSNRPSKWFKNHNQKATNSNECSSGTFVLNNAKTELESMLSAIAIKRASMSQISKQIAEKEQTGKDLESEVSNLNSELSSLNLMRNSVVSDLRILSHEKVSLEEELAFLGPVAANSVHSQKNLHDEHQSIIRRIAIIDAQLTDMETKRTQLKERISILTHQLKDSQSAVSMMETELRSKTDSLTSLSNEIRSRRLEFEKERSRQMVLQSQLLTAEKKSSSLKEEFEEAHAKALEHFSPPATTAPPVDDAQRTVKILEQQLESQRKAHSSKAENLQEDADRLLLQLRAETLCLNSWTKDLASFEELISSLDGSLRDRHKRWIAFRDIISKRADLHFRMFVSARGFYGRLQFDHEDERLEIAVARPSEAATFSSATGQLKKRSSRISAKNTDENSKSATQNFMSTDLKGLSGGEKSLITSCLLLSLWECVESPLRCLDEFDVFMDGINRKTILKMLMEYATSSNGGSHSANQYIFITPQALDLPETSESSMIKIIRLRDPTR